MGYISFLPRIRRGLPLGLKGLSLGPPILWGGKFWEQGQFPAFL